LAALRKLCVLWPNITLFLNTGGIPGSRFWRGPIPKYRFWKTLRYWNPTYMPAVYFRAHHRSVNCSNIHRMGLMRCFAGSSYPQYRAVWWTEPPCPSLINQFSFVWLPLHSWLQSWWIFAQTLESKFDICSILSAEIDGVPTSPAALSLHLESYMQLTYGRVVDGSRQTHHVTSRVPAAAPPRSVWLQLA